MNQAFIFDVFGTLLDWRTGVATQLKHAFEMRSLSIDPLAFSDYWRALYGPAMDRVRSGSRGYVRLEKLHRENLDETLQVFGIGDAFDHQAREDLSSAWERLPPWPDVCAGMARLQPLGFLAPCSNASIAMSVRMARYADFRWDAICGAELARDYKPSPSVYLAAATALALTPERVVMVAAHNGDLAAASQAGLRTAFFPRANEHGPGQKTNLVPDGDWDFVAADLSDLARKIEEQL